MRLLFALLTLLPALAFAEPVIGQPAPDFTLTDTDGKTHQLASYRGKTVVLEWFNPDCPFVVYAHGPTGPLAAAPKAAMDQGVVWLAVNSGAPGKQGAGQERNVAARKEYGMAYPVLLDGDGRVGKAYGARTTPHMFVIDPAGALVYAGALDDAPMGRNPKTVDYVAAALADLGAARAVATPGAKPYGCSVKYAD